MKKETEVKYPNSANLFRLCRRVLDHKYGGIRVIDQDVGQILSFDPADCSHWKKGKKNIRSIQAMKSIADHLGVDEKLVVDVATGELSDSEAFSEFNGYGAFSVDPAILETAKKEFYRLNAGTWSKEKELSFKHFFEADESKIDALIKEIHTKINFAEAPLYLPEVLNQYTNIVLVPKAIATEEKKSETLIEVIQNGIKTEIHYKAGTEMQPYMRFRIAKAIATHFLNAEDRNIPELQEYKKHMDEIEQNIFATKLLAPAHLIRKEMSQLNVAKDIVSQLAEVFWVSKVFMNFRLKSILQGDSQV